MQMKAFLLTKSFETGGSPGFAINIAVLWNMMTGTNFLEEPAYCIIRAEDKAALEKSSVVWREWAKIEATNS